MERAVPSTCLTAASRSWALMPESKTTNRPSPLRSAEPGTNGAHTPLPIPAKPAKRVRLPRGHNCSAANTKPRDTIAGLRETATAGGFVSSRHRDVCRRIKAGEWVVLSVVSSIEFLHGRLQQRLKCPAGKRVVDIAAATRPGTPAIRPWTILKLASRVVATSPLQVRPTEGRAQRRNIIAATGSSLVSLGTRPEPNLRSAFSRRLARHHVKTLHKKISAAADVDQSVRNREKFP